MNGEEELGDGNKRIVHYSLTEIIYGFGSGLTGWLTFEKFIEGRYDIGIACSGISIFTGLMAYLGHRKIAENSRELCEKVDSYRNGLNEAKKDVILYAHKLAETQVELYNAHNKAPDKSLEKICENNNGCAKVLPFKRHLRLVKSDEDPSKPSA